MSNKTLLQSNNTEMDALIDLLRTKSTGSGSEDLTAELTEYSALNTELESVIDSLPSAGGSGGGSGGSVETCTVAITFSLTRANLYYYSATTCDSNGNLVFRSNLLSESGTIAAGKPFGSFAISDVVCGSIIVLYTVGMNAPSSNNTVTGGGLELIGITTTTGMEGYFIICKAPSTAGAAGTITIA